MTKEITKKNYKEVLEDLWNKRWGKMVPKPNTIAKHFLGSNWLGPCGDAEQLTNDLDDTLLMLNDIAIVGNVSKIIAKPRKKIYNKANP